MMMYQDFPSKSVIDLSSEFNLEKKEIYFVSYFHQGKIHTKHISIIGKSFKVWGQNNSVILRIESDWEFFFKEKKLGNIVNMVMKFKDDSGYGHNTIIVPLIGKSPDESKIRFILYNLEAPYLKNDEKLFLNAELEYYKSIKPSMVKILKEKEYFGRVGGFIDNSEYFVKNNKDIYNQENFY